MVEILMRHDRKNFPFAALPPTPSSPTKKRRGYTSIIEEYVL